MAVNGDINNGTSILLQNGSAEWGAVAAAPTLYDAMFPAFAFVMVIVVPSIIAIWVIYKTLREKECERDEL